MSKKEIQLKEIRDEIEALNQTELDVFRKEQKNLPVMGAGEIDTNIIFIGEAPGKNEAASGKPFCGSAGKILDNLLQSISLKREDVYITNIVKDRPPKNRDPLPNEINVYGKFLDREIRIIKPKVLVTLGRYAMDYIMRNYDLVDKLEPISKAHGKIYEAKNVMIIPLYHPAAAIYNRQLIDVILEDIKVLKKYTK